MLVVLDAKNPLGASAGWLAPDTSPGRADGRVLPMSSRGLCTCLCPDLCVLISASYEDTGPGAPGWLSGLRV